MIIDCHGHYTTAPQRAAGVPRRADRRARRIRRDARRAASVKISDDEIRESLETAQLKLQRERGTDLTIFSPRASAHGASHRRRGDQPRTGREPATT